MKTITKLSLACAALVCAGTAPFAFAAGSGGGGSMNAAPSIDPQKAYKDGVTALQAKDYARAVKSFQDVLSVAPKDTNTNYMYGLALLGQEKTKEARRPLERAVKDQKAPADALLKLGLVNLKLGDRPKAEQQLTALAAKQSACETACDAAMKTEIKAAYDALQQALSDGATPPAAANPTIGWAPPGAGAGRAAYAEAVGLINEEHYEQALAALTRAEAAVGPHPDIFNYMGFASRKLGRIDVSLAYYQQALAIDPNHIGANEYLGELYLQMGRTEDAKRQLARLDDLCPYGCAQREQLAHWILASN